jgi:hypothetical protein
MDSIQKQTLDTKTWILKHGLDRKTYPRFETWPNTKT